MESKAVQFWSARPYFLVGKYPTDAWNAATMSQLNDRQHQLQSKKTRFFETNNIFDNNDEISYRAVSEKLLFWVKFFSWSYCNSCKSLVKDKLLPSIDNRRVINAKSICSCLNKRYTVPRKLDFPFSLNNLTHDEVLILRPLVLHTGDFIRKQHGYRQKNGFCRVSWSHVSVLQKIESIEDSHSRFKCHLAYRYLMTSTASKYSHFVAMREQYMAQNKLINMYDYRENDGIECALWPHLYPSHDWCETKLSGNRERKSSKVSFMSKVLSEILDYAMDYDLLQFHYDRWLFNTVSGAISSCRESGRSPASSLDSKSFSIEYWRWHHRFLQDALSQYGYPTLFLTISPYEWTFPASSWLQHARTLSGKGPTEIPLLETLHIVHILEQTVKGYLCGSNTKLWRNHVFNYNTLRNTTNVDNFFYRVEFQERGTAHVHVLVWLKNVEAIQYNLIRADIPWENKDMAFLVCDLQSSSRDDLPHFDSNTSVTLDGYGKKRLNICHPADAFARNIRGYITTVLPFLNCRMDVQVTDGKSMVLRYVTAYVSKFKEQQINDSLYSSYVSPAMAAYRHLTDMKPLEPEMVMSLSSSKSAWTNNSNKRFIPPRPNNAGESVLVQKYLARALEDRHLSMLEWLRMFDTTKANPTRYKRNVALVGVKYVSVFNSVFFFQHNLVNVPFTSLEQLKHVSHDNLPDELKHFAAATVLQGDLWSNDEQIKFIFRSQGNKEHHVSNVLNYIKSLRQMYALWQMEIVTTPDLASNGGILTDLSINGKQILVLEKVKQFLSMRNRFYASIRHLAFENTPPPPFEGGGDDQDDDEVLDEFEEAPACPQVSRQNESGPTSQQWTRIISITGKPGTGKTRCLMAIIQHLIQSNKKVLVATPTGFLASSYRAVFHDAITSDTIHSAFSIPVTDSPAQVNYLVANYDVLVMDEISMVDQNIFGHILRTLQDLSTRPVVIVCGDPYQQQPIQSVNGQVVEARNVYSHPPFLRNREHIELTEQHRCVDDRFFSLLNHLRHWRPNAAILNSFNCQPHLLHPTDIISNDNIVQATIRLEGPCFLTVSKKAATRINTVLISHFLKTTEEIAKISMDSYDTPISIYKNMKVIITQNRDKAKGVVNGQVAFIHLMAGNTILLRLPNRKIVHIYPVTIPTTTDNGDVRNLSFYPIVPGYALTICKAQGQTLHKCVIWFDCFTVPAGTAYVALSRVRSFDNLYFLTPVKYQHFTPVSYEQ